eukprot:scaffold285_cov330-Pavlova_lutheri.AAC.135
MDARAAWEHEHEQHARKALSWLQNLGLVPSSSHLDVEVARRDARIGGEGFASAVVDLGAKQDEPCTVLLVQGSDTVLQCIKQHFLGDKALDEFGCLYSGQTYEEMEESCSLVLLKVSRLVEGNATPILFTFDFVGMVGIEESEVREHVVELVKELMTKLKVRNMCQLASFREEHTLKLIPELARSLSTILSLFPPHDADNELFLERCQHIEGEISDRLATAAMRKFISMISTRAQGSDAESLTTHRE